MLEYKVDDNSKYCTHDYADLADLVKIAIDNPCYKTGRQVVNMAKALLGNPSNPQRERDDAERVLKFFKQANIT